MPSPTLERHLKIAAGSGGDVRLAKETAEELVLYRRLLFTVASQHQGGHSKVGGEIADALGATFPLGMDELEVLAEAEGFKALDLWPWLADMGRRARKPESKRALERDAAAFADLEERQRAERGIAGAS